MNITWCVPGSTTNYTLTAGSGGNGSVTLTPPGTPPGTFGSGTIVTLTPVPDSGFVFDSWSGTDYLDVYLDAGVYKIDMDGNKSIQANFAAAHKLTVAVLTDRVGQTGGTTSPAVGEHWYKAGTVVPVTATANPGFHFAVWSGGYCSGSNPTSCSVTMDGDRLVEANFAIDLVAMSVTFPGTGSGTVTSAPTGISCSSAPCSYSFDYNSSVTLTANPTAGSYFEGRGGACSGSGTCNVTMTEVKNVTATFNLGTCGTYPISQSSDDAVQAASGTPTVSLTANPMQTYSTTLRWWGFRFTGVAVPQGATVAKAYLTFKAQTANSNTGPTQRWYAQAVDDAPTFTATDGDLSGRARTAASVDYAMPAFVLDTFYSTNDISVVAQEVVNRAGWASGQSMTFLGEALSGTENKRIYSWDDSGTGNEPSLTICYVAAVTTLPDVTTQAVTGITATTATGNGNVTSLGSPNPTQHGVVWSTSANPTTANSKTTDGAVSATGAFTSSITGLAAGMLYHVRAYATNIAGTAYGEDVSFTTTPGAFGKTSPADTATGVATNPTLTWEASSGATSYKYCYAAGTSCTPNITTGSTSAALTGLSNNQMYYWIVQAFNDAGNTYSDGGSFWTFTTAAAVPPGAFGKTAPTDGATNEPVNTTLSWGTSTGATSYEYCMSTNPSCTMFTDNGAATSVFVPVLGHSQLYYWQVRAKNASGYTQANGGTFWSFTTIVAAPGAFNKLTPADLATGVSLNPTLSWGASTNATSYEYCYSTTFGCTPSTSTSSTSASISGLAVNTLYYWQVQAVNVGGTTVADTGAYISFRTGTAPAAFNKSTPTDGATNQSLSPSLTWGASTGVTKYWVCYDTSSSTCASSQPVIRSYANPQLGSIVWIDVGSATHYDLSGLLNNQTYYWQVKAENAFGTTYANSQGNTWSFTTLPAAPTATTGTASSILAVTATLNGTVNAKNSSTTVTFEYGLDTSYGTTVTAAQSPVSGTSDTAVSAAISGLVPNTLYHFRVVGVNSAGTTNGSDLTFTTLAAPPTVTTGVASSITSTGATLHGTVNANNASTTVTFQYGLDTNYGSTVTATQSPVTGTSDTSVSAAITGLVPNTLYHFRAVGVSSGGSTVGSDASFTSQVAAPAAFTKTLPTSGTTGVATNPTLSWGTSTGATSYEYCYATTTGCTSWISVGTATSIGLTSLSNGQQYFWQVRARNGGGDTLADAGTYWNFTTIVAGPAAFGKISPASGTTGVATNPTISWGTSANATSYEYCYATTTGCTSWASVGTATSVGLTGLSGNQQYFWQVRALNGGGNTLADTGTYWSFTTIAYTLTYSSTTGGSVINPATSPTSYGPGTVVTITAQATAGYHFVDWTGNVGTVAAPTNASTTITMNGSYVIVANFALDTQTHSIPLVVGWNLVSFKFHPVSTLVADVLASVSPNYDLVYAWNGSTGQWMKADNVPLSSDSLNDLNEGMGFWIRMTAPDTLEVSGSTPTSTNITLYTGWNLVGFPASASLALPGALSAHGLNSDSFLVYTYHPSDASDPWKLFDSLAPGYSNDLSSMASALGYWVKASGSQHTWNVVY